MPGIYVYRRSGVTNNADVKQHYTLTITFTEPLLGSRKDYKAAPHSYFYKDMNGRPLLLDRHIMGFFKEAARALNDVYGNDLVGILTRKVFIKPREMPLILPGDSSIYILDRPPHLVRREGKKVETREETSEAAPVGTEVQCELLVYPGVSMDIFTALLEYGALKGIGLGRNQGFGRFTYKLEMKDE